MSRDDVERFADIIDAIDAIRAHLRRGDLSDNLVYDAVWVRLIEIGEAVSAAAATPGLFVQSQGGVDVRHRDVVEVGVGNSTSAGWAARPHVTGRPPPPR